MDFPQGKWLLIIVCDSVCEIKELGRQGNWLGGGDSLPNFGCRKHWGNGSRRLAINPTM